MNSNNPVRPLGKGLGKEEKMDTWIRDNLKTYKQEGHGWREGREKKEEI